MSFTSQDSWIWPSYPRMLTPFDASRCYVLYDDVESNIPRWGSVWDFGAWDHARGVLVEVTQRLRGTAVSLYYRELATQQPHEDPATVPAHLPVGSEVTAVARDADGELVTVVWRRETAPFGPRGDFWQLTVNGVVLFEDVGAAAAAPPSLPWMAHQVYLHLQDRQPLAPVIPMPRRRPA